jgi:hypothetical protein
MAEIKAFYNRKIVKEMEKQLVDEPAQPSKKKNV